MTLETLEAILNEHRLQLRVRPRKGGQAYWFVTLHLLDEEHRSYPEALTTGYGPTIKEAIACALRAGNFIDASGAAVPA